MDDPLWYFFYIGNKTDEKDKRFDWIIIPAQGDSQKLYKLMEVTPQEHYFRYDGPYYFRYMFDGNKLNIGHNYAKKLSVPLREHGYANLQPLTFILDRKMLDEFIQEIELHSHWNDKESFLQKLRSVDLSAYNILIYRFEEPSGSIQVKVNDEGFIAQNVFQVTLQTKRPEIGTADMAYYALVYLIDKRTSRFIVVKDGEERVFELREYAEKNAMI